MNPLFMLKNRLWPAQITVEPSRLDCGLWGLKRGDIADAYCANTLPKASVFTHEGQIFTVTSRFSLETYPGNWEECADGYPLIPEKHYQPTQPGSHYDGKKAIYKGEAYRMGARVQFVARERSPEAWAEMLRRQYAYGGYFASGKTYAEVLEEFQGSDRPTLNRSLAIQNELGRTDLPVTQGQMLQRLTAIRPARKQMELEL